jgi:hypothetical protein
MKNLNKIFRALDYIFTNFKRIGLSLGKYKKIENSENILTDV